MAVRDVARTDSEEEADLAEAVRRSLRIAPAEPENGEPESEVQLEVPSTDGEVPANTTAKDVPEAQAKVHGGGLTPPAEDPEQPPSSSCSSQVGPESASDAAGGTRGLHVYAVWNIPGHPLCRGLHLGGARAWRFLVGLLPGGRYSYASGCRLRRYETKAEALVGYIAEADAHGAPLPTPIYEH
jgi:hypothetical protein